MPKFDFIDQAILTRHQKKQFRELRAITPGSATEITRDNRGLVNFCSNDYLGLSKHPLLIERSTEFVRRYGAGATASRHVCGTFACHLSVEQKLARLKRTESVLLMNSGYQANATIIPALADKDSIIFSDESNHHSIIQGIRQARCEKQIFSHNALDELEAQLQASQTKHYSRRLIVAESIYSMDGDAADIPALVTLARNYDAILVIDEAHATGVTGEDGMGLTVGKGVDVTIGTFGKALGSFGAYVACSAKMKDYLVNCCGGLIYTTALPPAVLGAIDAALDLVPTMNEQRARLAANGDSLRRSLRSIGYDVGQSSSQIIPIILGKEALTLAKSQQLEQHGFLASAIRPPTVPRHSSRIRVALCSEHTEQQIDEFIEALDQS